MKLTYIFHSGFALEAEECILVFDYWMDPAGVMPRLLKSPKPIYVFASHFHEDHFTKEIFGWRQQHAQITYILSKDILKHRRARQEEADVWLAKGATWAAPAPGVVPDGDASATAYLRVTATGSNDSGVSWIVEVEGRRIFHAGDLCNWYARFLNEEQMPDGPIFSQEFQEWINPAAEEKRFLGELKDVRRALTSHSGDVDFDLVLFPVDGRIGNGYTRGGRQFIERFSIGLFVPMHFVASGFESAWRMQPFCEEKGIPFWSIEREGETRVLKSDSMAAFSIRPATPDDLEQMHRIFADAKQKMRAAGNMHQWTGDYPSDAILLNDMKRGFSYIVEQEGNVVATFVLALCIEPTYDKIYEGEWLDDVLPYGTIHRIASLQGVHGVADFVMDWSFGQTRSYVQQASGKQVSNLRVDTHRDNLPMQHIMQKHGFTYCGIIYLANGDERLAYQKLICSL